MWTYILAGAVSGAVYSLWQFGNKVVKKDKAQRWKDFDPLRFGWTVMTHAGGGALGVWLVPQVSDQVPRTWLTAVAIGPFGEQAINLLVETGKKLYPTQ